MNMFDFDYDVSWRYFLQNSKDMLIKIESLIKDTDFQPNPPATLRFAKMPIDKIRIVILGQDPYPARGAATGRAFEASGLSDWSTPFRQVSLKNIVRALYHLNGGESYTPFSMIKSEILSGNFKILQPDMLFKSWETQGVLLLNTALTVEIGKPSSHSAIWFDFTSSLIKHIAKNSFCDWFLWGNHAIGYSELIRSENNGVKLYASRHPMLCSPKPPDDFLKNPCFIETSDKINWLGIS